jgi:hypothetical protein
MRMKLGFFIGAAMVTASYVCHAQSNSLGDRPQQTIKGENHKIQKPKISRRQKLLFRKPNVRNTAEYQYYKRVEQMAHEKALVAAKKKQLIRIPHLSYTAEYDFYRRVELAAHRRQKMIRKMAKPQYTEFAYFGHKHPPKRHLPYAMRYCKECGIRH